MSIEYVKPTSLRSIYNQEFMNCMVTLRSATFAFYCLACSAVFSRLKYHRIGLVNVRRFGDACRLDDKLRIQAYSLKSFIKNTIS
jgi:hypothetical protein